MAELSKNSTNINIKPKKEATKVNVKKGKISNYTSASCDLVLDKERLKNILENIPSAVLFAEKPEGKITYANKRAIELFGINPCGLELKNLPVWIYTLDGNICPTEELYTYRALFKEETTRNAPPQIIEHPNGKRFIVNVSAKPLYDKEGKVNAAIAIFDDATERSKTQEALKESEERLKMAQRIAHVGSWEYYLDEDKAIWSEELFRIFGLKPQKYGPNTTEYVARIHPQDREAINKIMEQMLFKCVTSKASFDYRIIRDDGSIRTIHSERMIKEVNDDKKPKRMIGVEQDITERKQIEQKIEEHTKNLEKLVDERTKQLKDVECLAAIGQTAGMIGHDIRNPLQAIVGELFLIKQDVDGLSNSDYKRNTQESLGTIQEQIDYINKIISDLQDFARPLKPELVEVDLRYAIPQLLSTVNVPDNIHAFAECGKKLSKLNLDLTFLKRILVNLATNAIQAMPNGGQLKIRTFEEGDNVSIITEDTGVGIPDEIKPKIFQPLMTTKSKGQGFGLAVVKRLVEAQGGTITFESQVGKGTQFKITFPKQTK
jgi:PAS domain S-box-containing protein